MSAPDEQNEKKSFARELRNALKKLPDVADDTWSGLRGAKAISKRTMAMFGPFIVSAVMIIVHSIEVYNAWMDLNELLDDEEKKEIKQRKVRYTASILALMLSTTGIALSLTFTIAALSNLGVIGTVAVSSFSMALFPSLIPALMACIYIANLSKWSYIFHRAKEEETAARNVNSLVNLGELTEKRLSAEREVAFATLELTASLLVTTGITLGSIALLGAATVASFGAAPLIVLFIGIGIGLVIKFTQYFDEKKDHQYTRKWRKFFFKEEEEESTYSLSPSIRVSPVGSPSGEQRRESHFTKDLFVKHDAVHDTTDASKKGNDPDSREHNHGHHNSPNDPEQRRSYSS